MNTVEHDIAVIGGGPAGMAAAVAAYDCGVKDVVIIDREARLGGILLQCIHNGFGLHKLGRELTGPEYAAEYEKKVKDRNIKVYKETIVTKIDKDKTVTASCRDGIIKIKAKAVILAMGCRERSRGALNISGTRPAGIYSAGTAQKLMNCDGYTVGRRAVILGSGDIGLIMARRMTLEGAKVEAVCEILPYSGGLKRNIVQCLDDFGIPLYLRTTVAKIHGKERVEGVTVAQVDESRHIIKGTERYITCDTLLLSCGLIPENELTRAAGIDICAGTSGAEVDEKRETGTNGIFACGNVLHVHDLVDYVSDEAETAGRGAAGYVMNVNNENAPSVPVSCTEGIRYVLPQRIHANEGRDTDIFLRVSRPFEKLKFTVFADGKEICGFKRENAAPGEMERLHIPGEKLKFAKQGIKVSIEKIGS